MGILTQQRGHGLLVSMTLPDYYIILSENPDYFSFMGREVSQSGN